MVFQKHFQCEVNLRDMIMITRGVSETFSLPASTMPSSHTTDSVSHSSVTNNYFTQHCHCHTQHCYTQHCHANTRIHTHMHKHLQIVRQQCYTKVSRTPTLSHTSQYAWTMQYRLILTSCSFPICLSPFPSPARFFHRISIPVSYSLEQNDLTCWVIWSFIGRCISLIGFQFPVWTSICWKCGVAKIWNRCWPSQCLKFESISKMWNSQTYHVISVFFNCQTNLVCFFFPFLSPWHFNNPMIPGRSKLAPQLGWIRWIVRCDFRGTFPRKDPEFQCFVWNQVTNCGEKLRSLSKITM